MARRVGIYTRISRDDEGEALAVARPRGDCERLADPQFFDLPIERQQEIIFHSLSAVIIHPAGRGARKFDPDLIEPIWRE